MHPLAFIVMTSRLRRPIPEWPLISNVEINNIGLAGPSGSTQRTVEKTVIKSLFFHIAKSRSETKQSFYERQLIKKSFQRIAHTHCMFPRLSSPGNVSFP